MFKCPITRSTLRPSSHSHRLLNTICSQPKWRKAGVTSRQYWPPILEKPACHPPARRGERQVAHPVVNAQVKNRPKQAMLPAISSAVTGTVRQLPVVTSGGTRPRRCKSIRTSPARPGTGPAPGRLLGARHHQHLLAVLLENPVRHAALLQQGAQGQQVFVEAGGQGGVKIRHQLTSASPQRSLSLQLA